MDNFDDIAEKYRNEIINLYNNQDDKTIEANSDKQSSEKNSADTETDIQNEEYQENNNYPIMPPAVSESALYNAESEKAGMGKGFLKITVTAGGAYPVENAIVIITRFTDGSEQVVNILQTNESGETPVIELDAPLANGTKVSDKNPYMYYNTLVSADGYYDVQNRNIALFSGITSIQPVNLIPLPAYTDERRTMTFYEQEPNL